MLAFLDYNLSEKKKFMFCLTAYKISVLQASLFLKCLAERNHACANHRFFPFLKKEHPSGGNIEIFPSK